ncbi:MAG: ATP-binding cassette domain-containing protein [Saprospiraceae bacterium]
MPSPLAVDFSQVDILQQSRAVLRGVDLRVSPGEFTYLVGKTGSGKSSLLKTIYAALPPAGGRAAACGYDLHQLNRRTIPQLRRRLGIVFQDVNLLTDRSVAANLRFVLTATGWTDRAGIETRVNEVLAAVDLLDRRDDMPFTLSGGEQQRVAFARALLNDPELLLADEATGNLDPETSDEILLLMRRLAKERNAAVIFATHDYRVLENFQARIIRCHEGRVFTERELRL